jgi:hypothetical protein
VSVLFELGQPQGIPHQETRGQASFGHLALRRRDCPGCGVDTGRVQAAFGRHEDVFAGAASGVEDSALDVARLGEPKEDRLRTSDVPRRSAGVDLVELLGGPGPRRTWRVAMRGVAHRLVASTAWPTTEMES